MEYQGIIFDFNGTLFFDNDKHVKAWNEISKILRGKEITLEELHTKLTEHQIYKIFYILQMGRQQKKN